MVVDLNHVSFSHSKANPNPRHLPKHEFPSPNDRFYKRIWYVQYYFVRVYMV